MFVVALCPDGHANANSAIVKILALKRYYQPYRKCFTGHDITRHCANKTNSALQVKY